MAGHKRKSVPRLINEGRAYLLVALMMVLGIFAKNFFTMYNMKSILDSTILYSMIGIGFTICMICGHMDLSVGYMANLGAVLVMGIHTLQKQPWAVALPVALLAGTLFGTINGLLITKGKIHSFIVTLGMQFVLKGLMSIYCNGAEIGDKGDYAFADFLNLYLKPFPLTPKVIVVLTVVIALAVILKQHPFRPERLHRGREPRNRVAGRRQLHRHHRNACSRSPASCRRWAARCLPSRSRPPRPTWGRRASRR